MGGGGERSNEDTKQEDPLSLDKVPEMHDTFLGDLLDNWEEDDTELPPDWESQVETAKSAAEVLQKTITDQQRQLKEQMEKMQAEYTKNVQEAAKVIRENKQNLVAKAEHAGKKPRRGAAPHERLDNMAAASKAGRGVALAPARRKNLCAATPSSSLR